MKIWANISHLTPLSPMPRLAATAESAGRNVPANTIGRPVRQHITSTSTFWRPW